MVGETTAAPMGRVVVTLPGLSVPAQDFDYAVNVPWPREPHEHGSPHGREAPMGAGSRRRHGDRGETCASAGSVVASRVDRRAGLLRDRTTSCQPATGPGICARPWHVQSRSWMVTLRHAGDEGPLAVLYAAPWQMAGLISYECGYFSTIRRGVRLRRR